MKILFTISSMTVEAGGVTMAVRGLAEELARRGHAITVAITDTPGTPVVPAGVTVKSFPRDNAPKRAPSRALDRFLHEQMPAFDVAHAHGIWQRPWHVMARWAKAYGKPYVVSPHGMLDRRSLAMGRRWAKRLAWWLVDGPMVRHAAVVHCLNQAEYRVSPWIHGRPTVVIGNGVDAEVFDPMPPRGEFRRKLVTSGQQSAISSQRTTKNGKGTSPIALLAEFYLALFLGRIHPKKGLDRLLRNWRALLEKHPDLLLVVAGAGEPAYVRSLQELCRREGIDHAVTWVGQLVGRDKWAALADADVFILPSHQEGFSLAITEAMAAGCPVVITRECNFDEVESMRAGVIVVGGDMPGFTRAVSDLLMDTLRRRALGENGRRLVRERFTWPIIAARMERVYEAIIRGEALPQDLRPIRRGSI